MSEIKCEIGDFLFSEEEKAIIEIVDITYPCAPNTSVEIWHVKPHFCSTANSWTKGHYSTVIINHGFVPIQKKGIEKKIKELKMQMVLDK